jgi:hypothetical protein
VLCATRCSARRTDRVVATHVWTGVRARGRTGRWLILRDTGLTEDGAELVCRASHGFAALETLDLSGNEITEAVVGGALAECLEVHSELLQLLLDDNELEDEGVEALAAILEQPTLLPKLQGASGCARASTHIHTHARTHARTRADHSAMACASSGAAVCFPVMDLSR